MKFSGIDLHSNNSVVVWSHHEEASDRLTGGNWPFKKSYLEEEDCAVISAESNSCLYGSRLSDGPLTSVLTICFST
jgi:hypothetical protein